MREVVIQSETSRRFFLRKSSLIPARDVKSRNLSLGRRPFVMVMSGPTRQSLFVENP